LGWGKTSQTLNKLRKVCLNLGRWNMPMGGVSFRNEAGKKPKKIGNTLGGMGEIGEH